VLLLPLLVLLTVELLLVLLLLEYSRDAALTTPSLDSYVCDSIHKFE